MYFVQCFILIGLFLFLPVISARKDGYKIYWNIPVQTCNYLGSNLTHVIRKFGFTHNTNEEFIGNQIVTIYNPGQFPALLNCSNNSSDIKDCSIRNGGIPQLGNLSLHLNMFGDQLNRLVPEVNSTAIIAIDMEDWRPMFNMNFGSLNKYREISRNLILQKHPTWTNTTAIDLEAATEFNSAAKEFMLQTLELGLKLRPKSRMGYYILPFCFNSEKNPSSCPQHAMDINDNLKWLYSKQTATMPDLYLSHKNVSEEIRAELLKSRTLESLRVSVLKDKTVPSYPYITYRYLDNNEIYSKKDLHSTFGIPKSVGAKGVVLWGSSHDIKTQEQCNNFTNFLKNQLGPIARIYIDDDSKACIAFSSQCLIIFCLLIAILIFENARNVNIY